MTHRMSTFTRVHIFFATLLVLLGPGSHAFPGDNKRDIPNTQQFTQRGGYVSYRGSPPTTPVYGATALLNCRIIHAADAGDMGSKATSSIQPPGWGSLPGGANGRQRCHVIGNALGGSGKDARNLFTCWKHANHPMMFHYERILRDWFRRSRSRVSALYKVDLLYENPNQDYPTKINVEANTFGFLRNKLLFRATIKNEPSQQKHVWIDCRGEFNRPMSTLTPSEYTFLHGTGWFGTC